MSKEIASKGDDFQVDQLDRGFAGGRQVALKVDGTTGTVSMANAALLAGKVMGFGNPQSLSGAGAVDVTSMATLFTSTAGAQALTMADGKQAGQLKFVYHAVDGGSGVLTPTHLADGVSHTITFTAAGDWALMQWSTGDSKWHVIAISAFALIA